MVNDMRILKCNITNFGCYSNKAFTFNPNLNSFCLNNGEGKTTLASFIKAMFYSLEKSSIKSYERKHYKPYSGGEYGGSIEIELAGKIYRIERTFGDSVAKDTLKIYDENGNSLTTFLSNFVSSLQGEASARLGELILGIDSLSFQKCNFISSNDLDFSSSESIKMKIGNIVIDRDRENSYEDTYDSIFSFDLREKKPTRNNENAYPYKIKELEKANKEKNIEIMELDKLEDNLNNLYEQRGLIISRLNEIEEQQRKLSLINVLKGKLDVIKKYDSEISNEIKISDNINKRYNYNLPSLEESQFIKEYLKEYERLNNIASAYEIAQSDILRLKELEGRVISDDDLAMLNEAYSKIIVNDENRGIIEIDQLKFKNLKAKFEGRIINDDINKSYYEYESLITEDNGFNYIKYPNEFFLNHINSKIIEYNNLNKKLNDIKSDKKESIFIKLFLIIITLGLYLFALNNKKKLKQKEINEIEEKLKLAKNELDSFFLNYNLEAYTYEEKLLELKQQIMIYNEKEKKYTDLLNEIANEKNSLITYFSYFGYSGSNIKEIYDLYKKELLEYNNMLNDIKRNEQILKGINDNNNKQIDIIKTILNKYNLTMPADFKSLLNKLKNDLDFYKKYNPIYINKQENDKKKSEYENKMLSIFNKHKIEASDIILTANNIIKDVKEFNECKKKEIEITDKKNQFIKDNNLNGFNNQDIDLEEEKLRQSHEIESLMLKNKENEISQNEISISRRDILLDEINENNELISNYQKKIEIAKLALKALEDAHLDMDAKYIAPIKNSFISYAKKIYEKIGANVSMNYDYEIKYDINGQLRDAKDLSDGERTIMMLALRFAVLDSMYKNHDSVIILDDPFDSLDSLKLKKAIDLIKALANDWQIIYFTCHDSRRIDC